ncbi:hypothetical protein CHLNCDRAFT_144158 [Chlorella variabilis]|uniref:SnoaL-like domain-containing protein n=1 Tax=Chlorella variabilis TaxID=554065 RepID=E1ZC17_CHLVA|nr:hypothetical protein CHLNCDRAFT_144158 [Chlorella variabilis]EFN56530.1 hypothetical protein CHLNCDRAFT_144158 [Chlorella variabilis]|eukprot:XP_005848632.1 hypothetical protein CHLNCDRAFT_144158 [Chlorella variabilis]
MQIWALEYEAASSSPPSKTLRRGDVAGVLRELRRDYARQYFVTALVTDAIYDPGCYFADPTVSFRGRDLYKRNLALLVPFLWEPAIQLRSLRRLPAPAPGGSAQLFAEWRLSCWVRLPWAPYVDINGTTTYTLNADGNQIVRHVEQWDVSAVQALLLLLRPSERAVWRQRGS